MDYGQRIITVRISFTIFIFEVLLFGLLFRIFLDVFLLVYIDQLRQMEAPRNVVRGDESLVVDSIRREQQEVEKLLKRKKELILREEEEEVQHPQRELSALDRLNLQTSYKMEFPEPARMPRFANKDWGTPATTEEHKKIILAWCAGSILFASMLGFIVVTWRCCRKKEENDPSPLEFVRGFFALILRRERRRKERNSNFHRRRCARCH